MEADDESDKDRANKYEHRKQVYLHEHATLELVSVRVSGGLHLLGPDLVASAVSTLKSITRGDAASLREAPDDSHNEPNDSIRAEET